MDRRNFFKMLGLGAAVAAGKKLEGKPIEPVKDLNQRDDVLDKRVKPGTMTYGTGDPLPSGTFPQCSG